MTNPRYVVVLAEPDDNMEDAADSAFHDTLKEQRSYNEKRFGNPNAGFASGPFQDAIWKALLAAAQPSASSTDH